MNVCVQDSVKLNVDGLVVTCLLIGDDMQMMMQ